MHLSTHTWVEDAIRRTDYYKPTMSLSRKRRRKQEQRRHHKGLPAPMDGLSGDDGWLSPERLFDLQRTLDESHGSTPEEAAGLHDVAEAPLTPPPRPACTKPGRSSGLPTRAAKRRRCSG